jgi:hypothetical protein
MTWLLCTENTTCHALNLFIRDGLNRVNLHDGYDGFALNVGIPKGDSVTRFGGCALDQVHDGDWPKQAIASPHSLGYRHGILKVHITREGIEVACT